ncbi:MAG: hypothetical protein MPN21_27280 [Thermoanaerobaculia bacterium]|nr:hypothetical protein [Thermoanaerobaculia bacterium]
MPKQSFGTKVATVRREVCGTQLLTMVLGLCLALLLGFSYSTEAEEEQDEQAWTDLDIESAIQAGCDAGSRLHRQRGAYRSFDVPGPLWLAEPGDDRARGVVLPTFLRLFLYGSHYRCRDIDLDHARPLAGPETWVVLWRIEEPHRGRSTPRSDQKVLRPTEVRLRSGGDWHHPVETRTRDRWANSWYFEDWDEKEGLVAVFERMPQDGSLFVDYNVEEDGRSYLTESSVFGLTMMPAKSWAMAHGEPDAKGGS